MTPNETCYLCEKPFGETDVLKHEEHIIQNAIGGKLRSDSILCEKCGEKLGGTVDVPFINALSSLSGIIADLARDRGDSQSAFAELKTSQNLLNCSGVEFRLNNSFELVPTKPVYIQDDVNKEVTIFAANLTGAEQFRASRKIRPLQEAGYAVVTKTNIAEHAEKILLRVDPEAPELLRGILKIAIEYAISKEVAPSVLKPLMPQGTIAAAEETLRAHVRQYYPTSDEEKLYEAYKFEHENWYPNHQLYLFDIEHKLYCYVELFGTIQKYVLLNSDYHGGTIREKFVQRCTKWNFDEKQWICRSSSDLDVVAREMNVETRGRHWDDIQKDILDAARTRAYALDPDDQIEKVKALVLNLAQFKLANIKGHHVVDQMMAKAAAAKLHFTFELADKLQDDPMVALPLLRRDFEDFRIANGATSCPDAADGIAASAKQAYASYKLFEFLMALDMQHVLEFKAVEDPA